MLKETVLADLHRQCGGKLVDFSGWAMPVNYGSQIEEHNAVRNHCGMFDVSHMTIVDVEGNDAQPYLQQLLANDVAKLTSPGKALYTAMLNHHGGVIDDLIVYLAPWGYRLVVNCATREKDLQWMMHNAEGFEVGIQERPEYAMLAIQGPNAIDAFCKILPSEYGDSIHGLEVFSGKFLAGQHAEWFVARTGYTGEDGLEIMLPNASAVDTWQALQSVGVVCCGLGARDTLRLEAGMNLYGHEMDESISPLQANMGWTIAWEPPRDFIGLPALQEERRSGPSEKLVGLIMRSRGVLREGYTVRIAESKREGVITSGSFSPTLGVSIALARVPIEIGPKAQVVIRGKNVDVEVVRPCFVRRGKPVETSKS